MADSAPNVKGRHQNPTTMFIKNYRRHNGQIGWWTATANTPFVQKPIKQRRTPSTASLLTAKMCKEKEKDKRVKQVRRRKHPVLAWPICDQYLTSPGVFVHTNFRFLHTSLAILRDNCSSTLMPVTRIQHLRPKLKANEEEKKQKIRGPASTVNVYWQEARNKLEKSTTNCRVIHYVMLTNPIPTKHLDWSESITFNFKFHRPANKK